ncbi:MAG: carbohydrate-binding domain-containing protein [Prevotellaceae bacterium]|nr:carbohydrate-binding domain-containing protein [Prevotellaceae bacterium]
MKKLLLATSTLLFAAFTWAGIIGDANNDGFVDVADITSIASHILGTTPEGFSAENADVNGDGTIDVADITGTAQIILGGPTIDDNTVLVNYNGTTANVQVANNIKDMISVTVDGADVSIVAAEALDKEVNYILRGTTTDGMFMMDGDYKCTITLDGVSITNNDNAAIDIECGKRIAIVAADKTGNSFTDGTGKQKAAFFVKGHAEIEGGGTINIIGNAKHAYRSDEYTQLKKKFTGQFNVLASASDGMHVGQYFQMNNGNVNISNIGGDGIQVEGEKKSEEADNGNCIIKGGAINITVDSIDNDALNIDSLVIISGGKIDIVNNGGARWEEEEQGIGGSAAISGKAFTCSDATINIKATGAGGKGISVDEDVTIEAGSKISIVTLGDVFEMNGDDTKPQCIKADHNIFIRGGAETYVEAFSMYGKGFSFDDESGEGQFTVDAYVLAVGEKKSEPTGGEMPWLTFTKQNIQGGQEYTIGGMTFTAPEGFSNKSAKVLVAYQ